MPSMSRRPLVPETEAVPGDAARLEALLQHSAVGLPVCTGRCLRLGAVADAAAGWGTRCQIGQSRNGRPSLTGPRRLGRGPDPVSEARSKVSLSMY